MLPEWARVCAAWEEMDYTVQEIKDGTVEVPAYARRPDGSIDLPWECYGPRAHVA